MSALLFTALYFQMLGFYVCTYKDFSCARKFRWSQLKERVILEGSVLALQECACLSDFQTCVLKLASKLAMLPLSTGENGFQNSHGLMFAVNSLWKESQ